MKNSKSITISKTKLLGLVVVCLLSVFINVYKLLTEYPFMDPLRLIGMGFLLLFSALIIHLYRSYKKGKLEVFATIEAYKSKADSKDHTPHTTRPHKPQKEH